MKAKTASRLAWTLWFIAIALAAAAVVFLVLGRHTPPPPGTFGFRGFSAVFAVAFGTVGALIASRRPENPIGWVFLSCALGSGFQEFCQQYAVYTVLDHPGVLPAGIFLAWIPTWIWVPITGTLTTFLFLLFPTGRLLSRRWRVVPPLAIVGIFVGAFGPAVSPGPLENFSPLDNPYAIGGTRQLWFGIGQAGLYLYAAMILVSSISLVVRFRRSRGEERQQLKLLISSATLVILTLTASFLFQTGRTSIGGWKSIDIIVITSFFTIPVATGVAILRYRLYDIDVVIKRAVAYGVLAAFITALYAVLVIAPAALTIGLSKDLLLPLAATVIIGAAFQPLRRRAQRFANRLVYGQRATPYEAMADFSHRMAGALSLEEVLPRMAEAAARGIGASRARVRVFLPDGEQVAVWPQNSTEGSFETRLTVTHQGKPVGEIAVAKPPADPIKPAEEKLLTDMASQAGLALSNVRLTEELQARLKQISIQADELRASRQRIVTAQDEERRRLERDIHDGAQQQLVSMKVKLGLIKQMIQKDPARAEQILDGVLPETNEAIESLRDLARGIFPPILVDQGLLAAVEAHVAKTGLDTSVNANGISSNARFDPSTEAAVYFCCLEAMQNASKHASGTPLIVDFALRDGWLEFSIADAGNGFDPARVTKGSGLQNMTDRVEAVGGALRIESAPGRGTTVVGRVPATARG